MDVAPVRVRRPEGEGSGLLPTAAIQAAAVTKLPAAIDLVSRREKLILDMARSPGFTVAKMRTALRQAGEIH